MSQNNYPPLHYIIEDMKHKGEEGARMVEVGPEDMIYLLSLSKGNRPLRQGKIEQLIEAILAGDWVPGDSAAMLTKEGVLVNFHHRAHAIIGAGQRVKMLIRVNCEAKEPKFIDTGIIRTPMDVPAFDESVDYLNPKNVVIARVCMSDGGASYGDRDLTNNAICNWVKIHKPQIDKVCDDFFQNDQPRKEEYKITQSVVQGAFTLAILNGKDEAALRFAARYLLNPASQNKRHGTNTLQEFRDALLKGKPTSAGGSARKDVFTLCCIFLNTFLINWADPNSKEMVQRPTWKKGKGYSAFKPIAGSFACPGVKKVKKRDPVFIYYLRLAMEKFPSNSTLSAAEIGRKMIEVGYKVNSTKPAELAAKKLNRLYRTVDTLDLGKGILSVVVEDKKKVFVWSLAA